MRAPSVFADSTRQFDVAMTPMIDVVFLLLIFFVWTASFQVAELLLPSELAPQQGSSQQQQVPPELLDLEQIVIRVISQDGVTGWLMNDEILERLGQVEARLARVAAIRTDLPVIVDPDPKVPLGDVIDIYDAATLAGFEKIQFTTSQ